MLPKVDFFPLHDVDGVVGAGDLAVAAGDAGVFVDHAGGFDLGRLAVHRDQSQAIRDGTDRQFGMGQTWTQYSQPTQESSSTTATVLGFFLSLTFLYSSSGGQEATSTARPSASLGRVKLGNQALGSTAGADSALFSGVSDILFH
jgi:hypothetical protein